MKRRWITISLAILMIFALTACNGAAPSSSAPAAATPAPAADAPEPADEPAAEPAAAGSDELVTLDWYVGLNPMTDNAMVNDAINEYLQERVNANVNMYFWTSQEIEQNLTTMISAGQDVGIIGFGSQTKLDYLIQASRGSFYPLSGLLDQYCSGTKALFNDSVWQCMTVDGEIYGIPSLKDNCYIISVIYNAELADQLGIDMSNFSYSSWRELEPWLNDAKAKRDEVLGTDIVEPLVGDSSLEQPYNFAFDSFLNDSFMLCANLPGVNDIEGYDTETVFNLYATPEYKDFALQRQRLVEKNINAYDYTGMDDWNYTGNMLAWVGWGYTYMQDHLYGDNFTTKMVVSDTVWTNTGNYLSAGTAISSKCANPEKAMQILELVNTDPDFATMWRFGVEGQHYLKDSEGKMTFAGSARNGGDRSTYGYYYWYAAPVGNLTIVNAPEDLIGPNGVMLTEMVNYNNNAIIPSYMGFVFDPTPVANEVAACTNVVMEYRDVLRGGQLNSQDQTAAAVDEFVEKLNANNVEAILTECQSQMDAWKAAQ